MGRLFRGIVHRFVSLPIVQKKNVRSIVEPFRLQTIEDTSISLPCPKYAFSHLQFRRFAGCPICDMHLRSFVSAQGELEEKGIREVVFFHSSAEALLKYNTELPFPVIADPSKTYYRSWGVETSLWGVLHPAAMWQGLKGVFRKGLGLSLENGPLGLPADFLLDSENRIVALKYGKHAYDQWSVDEVLEPAR